jgi:MFS family permease
MTIASPAAGQVPRSAADRSIRALGAVNFFLADVRDGLGPFLGVFLIEKGWNTGTIGLVMTAGGLAGMLATTPFGALADATKAKRLVVGICAALTIVASLAILILPSVAIVTASQIATGIAGAAIGPAIAGLTLGLVGQAGLAHQLGRNEAWNHGGNVIAAALAGLFGWLYGLVAVFALMTAMAVLSIASLLFIDPSRIDHAAARGLERSSEGASEAPASFAVLWRCTPLLVLAGTMMLFHLGNGALLPLLGQQAAAQRASVDPAAYTAATIIIAQLTMIPMALGASRVAESRGYLPILVAALVALPVRALIAAGWGSVWAVVPVQILDGVGAGLLGVAVPGLVARILRGTGHVNAGLGAVMTVQGVGASLSPAIAGFVAQRLGFPAAYLMLGGFALAGLILWWTMAGVTRASCAAGKS